jgi:hypothetical protein
MSLEKIRELLDDYISIRQETIYRYVESIITEGIENVLENDESVIKRVTPEKVKNAFEQHIKFWAEYDAEGIVSDCGIYDAVAAYHVVRGRTNYLESSLSADQLAYAVLCVSIPPVDEIIKAYFEED